MKTRLIYLVLLIVCFSCGTNNKPLSDVQKEKIKGEVKQAVNVIIRGAETAKIDSALAVFLNSPDFVYIDNKGDIITYKDFVEGIKSGFALQNNQEGTIKNETYAILDKSTVLYTADSKWVINFKDGHAVLQEPWSLQFTFKKVDGKWKVLNFTESGAETIIKPSDISKEFNQIELMEQFLGSWQQDVGKDTVYMWEFQKFGEAIFARTYNIIKSQKIPVGIVCYGFDKELNKFKGYTLFYGAGYGTYIASFTSPSVYHVDVVQDLNPNIINRKVDCVFVNPNLWTMTTYDKEGKKLNEVKNIKVR
jgi:Domain of unknown function (DUF4440)